MSDADQAAREYAETRKLVIEGRASAAEAQGFIEFIEAAIPYSPASPSSPSEPTQAQAEKRMDAEYVTGLIYAGEWRKLREWMDRRVPLSPLSFSEEDAALSFLDSDEAIERGAGFLNQDVDAERLGLLPPDGLREFSRRFLTAIRGERDG